MLNRTVLDAVRAEICEHEAAILKLREMERLALELAGGEPSGGQPERTPAPPRRERIRPSSNGTRRPRGAVPERKRAILTVLSARGPLSPASIAEAIDEPLATVRETLRALLADQELTANGTTSNRTYARRSDAAAPAAKQLSQRVRKLVDDDAAKPENGAHLEDLVLEIVKRVGGRLSISEVEFQLRKTRVEFGRGELDQAAGRLVTHGLVQRDVGGGLRLPERPVEQSALDAAGVESL